MRKHLTPLIDVLGKSPNHAESRETDSYEQLTKPLILSKSSSLNPAFACLINLDISDDRTDAKHYFLYMLYL